MAKQFPQHSDAWFSALVEHSSDLIIVLDEQAVVVYANPAAEEFFGISLDDSLGEPAERFIDVDNIEQLLIHHDQLVRSPGATHEDTVRIVTAGGEPSTLETVATNYLHHPDVGGIVINGRDVTDRNTYMERLEESFDAVTVAIANALDQRDPYTAGHQREVAYIAVAIARELGLPDDDVKGIEVAATLHDIGKIGIPAEILSRPGRLSATEFELIKTHAKAGSEIVSDVQFPWPVATMILQHHERLDGSGYPDGVSRDAILIGSRIISVADVLSAMSAHRPYRSALGVEAALDTLEHNRGLLYDADAVDACKRLIRQERIHIRR